MRPIFCGNFEYDARQSDLERLFGKYGKVDRVDMKSGFAFVYMEDDRDAEDAIRALDRYEFGRQGRRLRVEWTKQERGGRRSAGARRSSANLKPTKTLFVINFDPVHTRTKDLERHFDQYGKILNIRIRRNFAFIQFESQEEATQALDATNMSKLMDRVISVEYAVRDDDEKRDGGYSPDRRGGRGGRSPDRMRDRRRSPSPYRRERGSPDYGRRSRSPYRRERGSPDYGGRGVSTERRSRDPAPIKRGRGSPGVSPERRSRDRDGVKSSPPNKRSRGGVSPERRSRDRDAMESSPGPYKRERGSPESYERGEITERRSESPAPYKKEQEGGASPNYEEGGVSPERRRVQSPPSDPSPDAKSEARGSPSNGRRESPGDGDKYHSPEEES